MIWGPELDEQALIEISLNFAYWTIDYRFVVLYCTKKAALKGTLGVSGLLYWPLPIDLSQERAMLIEEAEQSSHNSASSKSASRAEVQEGKQVYRVLGCIGSTILATAY